MDKSWENCVKFFRDNHILVDKYLEYREEEITTEELKKFVHEFCASKEDEIFAILGKEIGSLPSIIMKQMETNLFRKMVRMRELEITKHLLPK